MLSCSTQIARHLAILVVIANKDKVRKEGEKQKILRKKSLKEFSGSEVGALKQFLLHEKGGLSGLSFDQWVIVLTYSITHFA